MFIVTCIVFEQAKAIIADPTAFAATLTAAVPQEEETKEEVKEEVAPADSDSDSDEDMGMGKKNRCYRLDNENNIILNLLSDFGGPLY